MTTASRLEELAGRVEASGGANSDIDRCIQAALVGATEEWQDARNAWAYHLDGHWVSIGAVLPYTTSLDAAMSLVPEGWRIYTGDFSIEGRFRWMLSGPRLTWITHEDGSKEGGDDWYQSGVAATPALALTAASLRSRASLLRTQGESNG